MGIVESSRKKPYKIVTWVLLGFGILFFCIGGLVFLTSTMNNPRMPNEIHLTTAGMNFNQGSGRHELSVFRKETSVMINTAPLGSGRRVTFGIDKDNHLQITNRSFSDCKTENCDHKNSRCIVKDLTAVNKNDKNINFIWPGERFYLTLAGDSTTSFQFGEVVQILIKSESATTFLDVKIVLPPDQIRFDFQIVEEFWGNEHKEISATEYFNEVYRASVFNPPTLPKAGYSYKFVPKLMVWGSEVRNVNTSITPVDFDAGIRLLGAPPNTDGVDGRGFENLYIPIEIIMSVYSSGKPMEFVFMITADYYGKHIDFYTLRIVQ